MGAALTAELRQYLEQHRVGRLATADGAGRPHLVPVTFALTEDAVVFVIDEKPKRAHGTAPKRMRNILANPRVAFLVDHYDDDWNKLTYALIVGSAEIVARPGAAYAGALSRLRTRYPQYRDLDLTPERNPIVRITPERIHRWSATAGSSPDTRGAAGSERGGAQAATGTRGGDRRTGAAR
jgi:PPOX class probable F420-dependent enzyme